MADLARGATLAPPRLSVVSGACIRESLLSASCVKCVEVCPLAVIDLGSGSPVIDTQSCTGCGACAGACPEAVFTLYPAFGVTEVCREHPGARGLGVQTCVHAMGLRDLATLYQSGTRKIVVATGNCDICEIAPLVTLDVCVDQLNDILISRDLPVMQLTKASGAEISAWRRATIDRPDLSRRGFLRQFAPEETAVPSGKALFELLSKPGVAPVFPHVPYIDASTCTGCDDCINICPHDALTLVNAGGGDFTYTCTPERCTGCALCSDICEADAVELRQMTHAAKDISLRGYQCRACGVVSRTTASAIPDDGLCRICAKTNHHKNLFVVLE